MAGKVPDSRCAKRNAYTVRVSLFLHSTGCMGSEGLEEIKRAGSKAGPQIAILAQCLTGGPASAWENSTFVSKGWGVLPNAEL